MNTNNNEKLGPMEENRQRDADFELDRRLVEEINILKLEGLLFCFDPKEAKRRRGKLTLADVRKQPVTVFINPQFGQPSVLAYKVLQAIFLKVAESGCSLTEDGRCLYDGTVSFSARELAALTGRTWSGRTSHQLFEAIMQLQATQVIGSLYVKARGTWETVSFVVLPTAYFAGKGETITRCSVQLHAKIVESVNRRHVATFNLNRLRSLDTIGLVLYKRIFFHFSNLMHDKKGRGSLRFTKDYEAICKEWLGGLKPLQYKAHILKDQLGRHFDALQATGLIGRTPALEKNKAGNGFNVTFHPGSGFFEDYQAYYLDKKPARLTLRSVAELQEVKALELVAHFHRQLGRLERTRFEDHETAYASELLATHTETEVRDLIDYAIEEAKRTKWADMLYLGACKRFVDEWSAGAARRKNRERREATVAACPHCTKDGMLELREQGTNRVFVHLCPHKLEHIAKIEEGLKAYRI
jgi:hypothetical protein